MEKERMERDVQGPGQTGRVFGIPWLLLGKLISGPLHLLSTHLQIPDKPQCCSHLEVV